MDSGDSGVAARGLDQMSYSRDSIDHSVCCGPSYLHIINVSITGSTHGCVRCACLGTVCSIARVPSIPRAVAVLEDQAVQYDVQVPIKASCSAPLPLSVVLSHPPYC